MVRFQVWLGSLSTGAFTALSLGVVLVLLALAVVIL